MTRAIPIAIGVLFALGGCGVPQVVTPYRIDIQQGNYVSQEMVAQLKPGMSMEQVRFILGTPLVTDIFHAERWDYVYYRELRGGGREQRKISVHFEAGKLARVSGDVVPAGSGEAAPAKPAVMPPKPGAEAARPAAEPEARPASQPAQNWTTKNWDAEETPAPREQEKPAAEKSERGFFGRILEKLGF
ncbi:MAG: outer membrane protein assembly factor BamE [Burkholderiales bacterium]